MMKPDEARKLRGELGLTQIEMARKLGTKTRTYRRWEKLGMPEVPSRLLAKLVEERAP